MTVSTFPASLNFLEALAHYLVNSRASERMLETVVLLPTRRACRNLKDELKKLTFTHTIILPKIFAIADVEKDPVFFAELVGLEHIDTFIETSAISPIERRFHLAKLCSAISIDHRYKLSFHKSFELADALGHLLDELQRQEITIDHLEELPPEIYAEHWQEILKFLRIITQFWPEILAEKNKIDPIEQRNRLFKKLSELWQDKIPDFDIIIAGSTGSNLAVAKLMSAVARLSNGEVVLPAFPIEVQDAEWKTIRHSHPYFFLKRFLYIAQLQPSDVTLHTPLEPNISKNMRSEVFARAMLPAELIHLWSKYPIDAAALYNLQYITAETREQEALQIAIICKNAIAGNIRDICLVVEDIGFRKMLTGALECMSLQADASEGKTIGDSSYSSYADLLILAARDAENPLHILALLKHPYTHMQHERKLVLDAARFVEKTIFRTQKYAPTIEAMLELLTTNPDPLAPIATRLLKQYQANMLPLSKLIKSPSVHFSNLYKLHLELMELFAMDDVDKIHCWGFDETGNAEIFLRSIVDHAAIIGEIDPYSYDKVLSMLLDAEPLRITRQNDYHINIMPSEEARLQPAELMIVADMNEGIWPEATGVNPWMSRPMQAAIGLLMPETEASQKAHDLLMMIQADKVILSRSLMDERAETTESRWLQRLNAYLSANSETLAQSIRTNAYAREKADLFKAANIEKESQPQPKPEKDLRPTTFSITELETMQRDPYAIYARHILKLKPLEALGGMKEQTLFGEVAHHMLEQFVKAYPDELPEILAHTEIEQLVESALQTRVHDENLIYLWRQKLKNIMLWVLDIELARRPNITHIASEVEISAELVGEEGNYTLKGRADRVEIHRDGSFKVVDYKTGTPPKHKDMENHIAGQLAVAAWLMQQHWPEQLPYAQEALQGEYWKLNALARNADIVLHKKMNSQEFLKASKQHITMLLDHYKQASTAYTAVPDRSLKPAYHTYDQLERYAEWA